MTTTAKYNKSAWLGNYPAHWQVLRIKNIFSEIEDRSTSGNEELLSVSHYTGVTLKRDSLENEDDFISNAETLEGYKRVAKGDLVINIMLAWNGSLGISPFDGITSPAYCVYRAKENNNPEYFGYLFATNLLKTEFRKKSTGIIDSRLRLYSDKFFSIFSVVPPVEEQNQIVEYIKTQSQKINHFIAKKQQFIALLKEQRQSVINEAVKKGTRTRLKNIVTTNDEALGESTDENYLLRYIDIGNVNSNGSITDIQEFTFKNAPSRARRIVKKGDIIISTVRTYLQAITLINEDDENLIASTGFAVLRPKKNVDVEFLNYALRGNNFIDAVNKNSYGVSYPAINSTTLSALSIFIPNIKEEQTQIVNHIKTETATIDTAIAKTEREIELIKEYKEAMIAEAVMGKVNFNKL
jgi:type I restriction enzyme S subunit